jgi:hypothetical protein
MLAPQINSPELSLHFVERLTHRFQQRVGILQEVGAVLAQRIF